MKKGIMIKLPPQEDGLYRIVYVADVVADSHLNAAQVAYQLILDPESYKPIFDIIDPQGVIVRVDLNGIVFQGEN